MSKSVQKYKLVEPDTEFGLRSYFQPTYMKETPDEEIEKLNLGVRQ